MASIKDIEKFLNDHPELFGDNKDKILIKAKTLALNGMISGEVAHSLMGGLTDRFLSETIYNEDHFQMGNEDLIRFACESRQVGR